MESDVSTDGRLLASTPAVTNELSRLVAEIDEFKGAWRAISRIAPDRLSRLRRVATIESIGSSTRIEGARLTDREVEGLFANIDVGSIASLDEQEIADYADAMETVFANWQAIDLSENRVRQLHLELLRHIDKDARHRGEYKTQPNQVEAFDTDGCSRRAEDWPWMRGRTGSTDQEIERLYPGDGHTNGSEQLEGHAQFEIFHVAAGVCTKFPDIALELRPKCPDIALRCQFAARWNG